MTIYNLLQGKPMSALVLELMCMGEVEAMTPEDIDYNEAIHGYQYSEGELVL